MRRYSTIFLKVAVILIGIPVLILGIYGLLLFIEKGPFNPKYDQILYPIFIAIYISVIPFYFALYKAFKLLGFIDENKAFSQISVNALKSIKYCAITNCGLYVLIMPFVYLIAEYDDAPGLIIIAMVPVFASMVIAVFAAVLQRLLQDAIDLKSEIDLTV